MKYYLFGANTMLWMSLLWINKLREVTDSVAFHPQKHYMDGPNSYIAAMKLPVTKVMKKLSKADKKEIYTLLGGTKDDDSQIYNRVINSFSKEVREVMLNFPKEVA